VSAGQRAARGSGRRVRLGDSSKLLGFLEPVLDEKSQIVPLVEDLCLDVRIEGAQPADLAVLLGDELLVERRDLDVDVEVREIEVRREALCRLAVGIPGDVEGRWLVLPRDLIEVQELGELPLAVVGKGDRVVWKEGAVRPAPGPSRRYVSPPWLAPGSTAP
jgi:hypothetical protein